MPDGAVDEQPSAALAAHHAAARAVYGLIIVMAVLEAMELHPPAAGWEGAELLLGTVLAVALAEVYADLIAGTLVHNKRPSGTTLGLTMREAGPLLIGAPLPVIVLVLSALGLVEIHRAIDLAQIIAYTTLLIYGWRAAWQLDSRVAPRVITGLTFAGIGFLLVALKAAFH
jgi:hypothetical protein